MMVNDVLEHIRKKRREGGREGGREGSSHNLI